MDATLTIYIMFSLLSFVIFPVSFFMLKFVQKIFEKINKELGINFLFDSSLDDKNQKNDNLANSIIENMVDKNNQL